MPNGDIAEGEFKNGALQGTGYKRSFSTKTFYKGTFIKGYLNGKGTRINFFDDLCKNISQIAEGDFFSSKPHGYARIEARHVKQFTKVPEKTSDKEDQVEQENST